VSNLLVIKCAIGTELLLFNICIFLCVRIIRDFLPRGSGIVTRRPLVLQLLTAKTGVLCCGVCVCVCVV